MDPGPGKAAESCPRDITLFMIPETKSSAATYAGCFMWRLDSFLKNTVLLWCFVTSKDCPTSRRLDALDGQRAPCHVACNGHALCCDKNWFVAG